MKTFCLALAALAAMGFTGAAYAGDAGPTTTAKVSGPTAMSDAEMDKVTAGQGFGVETAYFSGSAPLFVLNQVNLVTQGDDNANVNVAPGHGKITRD